MALNEKMMILKMLDEGKITVEESIKLIKACDQTSTMDEIVDNLKRFCEIAREKVEPVCEEVLENAKEAYKKAEPTLMEVKENIKKAYKDAEPKLTEAKENVKKACKKAQPKVKEAIEKVKKECKNKK